MVAKLQIIVTDFKNIILKITPESSIFQKTWLDSKAQDLKSFSGATRSPQNTVENCSHLISQHSTRMHFKRTEVHLQGI